MAVDSPAKRASALNFAQMGDLLPIPDGSVGQSDRQQVAGFYGGILSIIPPLGIYNLYVAAGSINNIDFDSPPAIVFPGNTSSGDLVSFGFAASTRYTLVLRPETNAGLETPSISAITEFVTDGSTEWTGLRPDPITSLTAKVVADGVIRLTWYHRIFDGATPDDFEINFGTTPSATGSTQVVTYSGVHRYTVNIDPGNEQTHWFSIVARTAGLDSDPVRTLGITPDDTAPDAPNATASTTWQTPQ